MSTNDRVVVPKFGALLKELRDRRQLSQGQVRLYLKQHGIDISASGFSRYENGTRPSPDPGFLWVCSKLYGVETDNLIAQLVAERAGVPLPTLQMIERPGDPSPQAMMMARQFDELELSSQLAVTQVLGIGVRKKPSKLRVVKDGEK